MQLESYPRVASALQLTQGHHFPCLAWRRGKAPPDRAARGLADDPGAGFTSAYVFGCVRAQVFVWVSVPRDCQKLSLGRVHQCVCVSEFFCVGTQVCRETANMMLGWGSSVCVCVCVCGSVCRGTDKVIPGRGFTSRALPPCLSPHLRLIHFSCHLSHSLLMASLALCSSRT